MTRKIARKVLLILVISILISVIPAAAQDSPLILANFFGDCSEQVAEMASLDEAATECQVIAAWVQMWNAENPDNPVQLQTVDWPGTTYFNTNLAAGTPPDMIVMGAAFAPAYASRGLIAPLDDVFASSGIDFSDYTPGPAEFATINGQVYGLPLDNIISALLHINLDIWAEAGLVADGAPVIPTSVDEFLAAAQAVKDATGLPFVVGQVDGYNAAFAPWATLVLQQGGSYVGEDLLPNVDTPEGLQALNFLVGLLEQGYMTPALNYGEAETAFINGEAAGLINGGWAIPGYTNQIANDAPLQNYTVIPFPAIMGQPAAVGGTHLIMVPSSIAADSAKLERITPFMDFVYSNQVMWARTGHIAARTSDLESEVYANLPYRDGYANAGDFSYALPEIGWAAALENIMTEEIVAAYVGSKTAEQALADAQARLTDIAQYGS